MAYTKTIHTARLTLRPPQRGDETDLFAIHADPAVMRYSSEPPWTGPARAGRQIDEDVARFEREESFRFFIILNDTGRQIGNCTLYALHRQNRRADIGYALARAHWGRDQRAPVRFLRQTGGVLCYLFGGLLALCGGLVLLLSLIMLGHMDYMIFPCLCVLAVATLLIKLAAALIPRAVQDES